MFGQLKQGWNVVQLKYNNILGFGSKLLLTKPSEFKELLKNITGMIYIKAVCIDFPTCVLNPIDFEQ